MRDAGRVGAFLEALSAERGAARNTLAAYERDLRIFGEWLAENGRGLLDADRSMIEAWLEALDVEGLSPATRALRLSSVRQFYRFAFTEGWRADDPGVGIAGPARARALRKTMTIKDVERLLAAAAERCGSDPPAGTLHCVEELLYA